MNKLNIGFMGLGNMGYLHLMNSCHMNDVNIISVADKSKMNLKKAENIGIKKLYEDYHDMINKESKLDAVVISLPNHLHFDSIKLSLEAGLNIFVEKPISISYEECTEVIKLVDKYDRTLMPGHCMRFLPAIEQMKDSFEKGKLGDLEIITLESIQNGPLSHGILPKPVPEWWFDPSKSGGGALIDLGYHLIDLFRFFAGESTVNYSYLGYKFNLPVEDNATVILNSKNSVRGVINVGWFEKTIFPKFNFRMILHGDSDFLSTEQFLPRNMYTHAIKTAIKNLSRRIIGGKIKPLAYTYYYESHFKELDYFYNCLKNDIEPSISAIDGLRTIEIINNAYKYSQKDK